MKEKLTDIKETYLIGRIRGINTPLSVIERKTTQKSGNIRKTYTTLSTKRQRIPHPTATEHTLASNTRKILKDRPYC